MRTPRDMSDAELTEAAAKASSRLEGAADWVRALEHAYEPLQLEILRRGLGDALLRSLSQPSNLRVELRSASRQRMERPPWTKRRMPPLWDNSGDEHA